MEPDLGNTSVGKCSPRAYSGRVMMCEAKSLAFNFSDKVGRDLLLWFMASGYEVPEAVKKAKNYLEKAIRGGFALGQGVGVLDHFADCRNS